ncbi:hypothetical protein DIPPA_04525 [Diplonema papillatum]|nr:hypothetical protein DIPPA_04525 [Diplonema papillatum]
MAQPIQVTSPKMLYKLMLSLARNPAVIPTSNGRSFAQESIRKAFRESVAIQSNAEFASRLERAQAVTETMIMARQRAEAAQKSAGSASAAS